MVDATLGFYIRDFICKEFKTYNLAHFLKRISIKMPANVIIKKAPILFLTSIHYWRTLLLLISTFYLSLLSLQTVIYVPFFVFQKIAFTSSIVDPDQNARISVTSVVRFQDRREIRRLINMPSASLPT